MKKVYKFDYGNVFKFILSEVCQFLHNAITLIISGVLSIITLILLQLLLKNQVYVLHTLAMLFLTLNCIFGIYLLFIIFLPKKAIIKNGLIEIKRYCFDLDYPIRGLNDKIYIKDIIECNYYAGKTYSGVHKPYAVYFFNWDNLIKIKTKNSKGTTKEYYVPIKNSEEFITEINSRMKKIQFFAKLGIDDLLKTADGEKLSYYDLGVRWKGKDEIDSIYYTDKNGNKIDLIKY